MKRFYVRYRHERTGFVLPSGWRLLKWASFEDDLDEKDALAMTRHALEGPIKSYPLRNRLSPSDRVAVIIEDLTRSSPKRYVLRGLLEELQKARLPKENITIVVALGTHRKLTRLELANGYGQDVGENYLIVNHDCYSPDLVPVGRLKTGTQVKINRKVYEANFRIGVGSICPHPMNGFGGGGKIVFPGVADFDSILEHHLKYSFRAGSELGKLQGNPFYEEVCELAAAAKLDFIVNGVLDNNDRLCELVCGNPFETHLAGIELSRRILSMRFEKKADVTLVSSFPYTEGPQIMKALAPAAEVTKDGGVIILAADCTAPLPDTYVELCERFRLRNHGRLKEEVLSLFERNRRIIEDGPPELNLSIAQLLLTQNDFRVILLSEDIPQCTAERLGFLYAKDLKRAFDMAETFFPCPGMHVIPSGGVILPLL
jgi:nickel-dependent lactate racemase